jgi:hypothetical protein
LLLLKTPFDCGLAAWRENPLIGTRQKTLSRPPPRAHGKNLHAIGRAVLLRRPRIQGSAASHSQKKVWTGLTGFSG